MKADMYTRIVLTLLLVVMTALTLRLYTSSESPAFAQTAPTLAPFGISDSSPPVTAYVMDPKTGRIYAYTLTAGSVVYVGRLVEVGKPLQK